MNSTEKRGEEPKKITGLIGMKFGCLQVVDDGTEYLQVISARIASVEEEKLAFIAAVKEKRLVRKDRYGWNGEVVISTPAYVYTPKTFEVLHYDCVTLKEFDAEILKLLKKRKLNVINVYVRNAERYDIILKKLCSQSLASATDQYIVHRDLHMLHAKKRKSIKIMSLFAYKIVGMLLFHQRSIVTLGMRKERRN